VDDKKVKEMNEGRALESIRPHLEPILDIQTQRALNNLLQAFRSNESERAIFCQVAKLSVLSELKLEINQRTERAKAIMKELADA
jgi:hypothetical protein